MNLNRRQLIGTAAAGCCAAPALAHENLFLKEGFPKDGRPTAELPVGALRPADEGSTHVVLLGDSVFDNQRYVPAGGAVADQVRRHLPATARVTLLATDGHTTRDIAVQLQKLPSDATHLVLSVGGNDALAHSGILSRPAAPSSEIFLALADIRSTFERDYARMLDQVLALQKSSVLCTIYDPRFSDQQQQKMCVAALGIFNDVITRAAGSRGLPLVDLRLIFSQSTDYANAIEPGVEGGTKLARALSRAISQPGPESTARIYT